MRAAVLVVCIVVVAGLTGIAQERSREDVVLPRPTKSVKPGYTQAAIAAGIQGSVLVEVEVLEDGKVGEVRVVESLDAEYGLDQQALEAAKQWEFRPGTKAGKPVAVRVNIEMTFRLKG
jgi:protein TonB